MELEAFLHIFSFILIPNLAPVVVLIAYAKSSALRMWFNGQTSAPMHKMQYRITTFLVIWTF